MHKNGKHYITLTPTCPEINKLNMDYINNFAGSDLKEKIKMLLKLHPQLAEENEGRFTLTKNQNFCEFHSHPLVLCNLGNEWNCEVCQEKKVKYYNCYYCSYCDYHLCKTCYDASNI